MVFFQAIGWIAATAVTIVAASSLAKRSDPSMGAFHAVHVTILAWAWIVMGAVALSAFHALSGPALLIIVPTVGLLTLALFNRGGKSSRQGLLEIVVAFENGSRRRFVSRAAWAVILTFCGAHVVTRGLLQFPTDFDSLMYHIPMVDRWLQEGSLYAPDGSHWFNPGGNELVGLWMAAPFSEDFLVVLGNVPATILLALGTRELGGLLGLSPALRNLSALAIVSNLIVVHQMANVENDMAVAGLFTVSLCYGVRFANRGRAADLVLGAFGTGLLCGIKYYALGHAFVAWLGVSLFVLRRRGAGACLLVVCVWGMGAVLLGGHWYARNAIVSGSPFYPLVFGSRSGGPHMDYPNPWRTTFLGNGRVEVGPLAFDAVWRMAGPCHLAAIIALPLVFAWLAVTGARSARTGGMAAETRAERVFLAFLILGSGAVLAITPMALEDRPGTLNHLRWGYTPVRYGLSFLVLAVLGFALFLQETCGSDPPRRGRGRIFGFVPKSIFAVSVVCQLVFLDDPQAVHWLENTLICVLCLLIGLLCLVPQEASPHLRVCHMAALWIAISMGLAVWAMRLAEDWNTHFVQFYGSMHSTQIFDELAALRPRPRRIALFDYRCRPFLGACREFHVFQPRDVPTYERLIHFVRDRGASFVITRSRESDDRAGWDVYGLVGHWAAIHPDDLEFMYRDRRFSLYRVLPGTSSRSGPALRAGRPSSHQGIGPEAKNLSGPSGRPGSRGWRAG